MSMSEMLKKLGLRSNPSKDGSYAEYVGESMEKMKVMEEKLLAEKSYEAAVVGATIANATAAEQSYLWPQQNAGAMNQLRNNQTGIGTHLSGGTAQTWNNANLVFNANILSSVGVVMGDGKNLEETIITLALRLQIMQTEIELLHAKIDQLNGPKVRIIP